MLKIFIIYCAAFVILLAIADQNGYVYSSAIAGSQKADKAANHYHK